MGLDLLEKLALGRDDLLECGLEIGLGAGGVLPARANAIGAAYYWPGGKGLESGLLSGSVEQRWEAVKP
jgi:hypothetical protein